MAGNNRRESAPATQLVTTMNAPRLELTAELYEKYKLDAEDWRNLVDQLYPSAKSAEAVMLAVNYCRKRGLDVMKRPVHIVPVWSTLLGRMVETVWPSIAEIRTTAARTAEYAGIDEIEYGPEITREFVSEYSDERTGRTERKVRTVTYPEWARVTVYRIVKGTRCPFTARVRWTETYGTSGRTDIPNDMWCKRPYGQLDKCVEAAALRVAFPEEIGNDYVGDEMEGKSGAFVGAPIPDAPRRGPPPAPVITKEPEAEIEDAVIEDAEEVQDERKEEKAPEVPAGPPPAPTGPPAGPQEGGGRRKFGDLVKEVRTKLHATTTEEDLVEAWTEYEHLAEKLEPVKWSQIQKVYDDQLDYLQAVAANVMGAG